jgi:tetratricopeptide (TPR) repeat protein
MKLLRLTIASLLILAGVVAGGLAALGWIRWGAAGWYYHRDAAYRLRCGQEALRQGKSDRVDQIILLLEADGHKDQAHLLRGEMYVREGKEYAETQRPDLAEPSLHKAEVELNKIRDKGDLRLDAATLLGQTYFYLKRYTESERAFLFVLAIRPDQIDAHRGLASIYFNKASREESIRHLRRVAELDPQDGRPYQMMGHIYKILEDYPDAIDSYRKALERTFPERSRTQFHASIRQDLADCLVQTSQYAPALEILEQLQPSPQQVSQIDALRGQCLFALDRKAEATALLDQALADDPNCVELLRVRSRLHMDVKEWVKAVKLLEQALAQDRHDYISRLQLMQVYRSMGQTAKADEQQRLAEQTRAGFQELNDLSQQAMDRPNDAAVRLRAAQLCDRLDRTDLAAMWRQAAAACPPAPGGPGTQELDKDRQLQVVAASAIGLGAGPAPGIGLAPVVAIALAASDKNGRPTHLDK